MTTIPQQHYYDPQTISPTDPEPRHRCHCGFRFDRWEEFTEHIVRVTVTAAQTIIDAPAKREFTGSASRDSVYSGKRQAFERVGTVR